MPEEPKMDEAAQKVAEEVKKIAGEASKVKTPGGFWSLIRFVVKEVESFGKSNDMDGVGKKTLAIQSILLLIPLPPWIPRPIFVMVVSALIEMAVKKLEE